MALKIRLARGGAKKRPYYSIVVADGRSPRDGRFIEKIGTYNPMLEREHPERVTVKQERAQYWIGKGAQPTDRVAKFFGQMNLIEMPPIRETPKKSAPGEKALERQREREEKAAEAAAAAEEAAAEASGADEAETAAADEAEAEPAEEPAAEADPVET